MFQEGIPVIGGCAMTISSYLVIVYGLSEWALHDNNLIF